MPLIPPFDWHEHIVAPWTGSAAIDTFWTVAMGALVAVACAWMGCYLVLQRLALLGDAISHTVLLGIVVVFLITGQVSGWPLMVGALVTGLLTGTTIEFLHRSSRLKEDAAMGIVFTTLFAVGVVLLSTCASRAHIDTQHVLFGSLEFAVREETRQAAWSGFVPPAVAQMGLLVLLLGGLIAAFYKELLVVAFDREFAQVTGVSPHAVKFGMLAVLSLLVVSAFEAVGAILVVAMLITPAATACLLTDRVPVLLALAAVCGMISALVGYHLALWWDVSTSGSMVCVACGLFVLSFLFSPRTGQVVTVARHGWRRWRSQEENLVRVLSRGLAGEPATDAQVPRDFPVHELARSLGISKWRLRLLLATLRLRQWVALQGRPAAVRLTRRGQAQAVRLDRTHRLWERFLVEQLGMSADHVHRSASELEHLLDEQLVERVDDALGHPDLDPHGAPIPRSPVPDQLPGRYALSKLRVGDRGVIVALGLPPSGLLERAVPPGAPSVAALGLPLGQQVRVVERNREHNSWTIELPSGQQIVVPHDLADCVLLSRDEERAPAN